MLPLYLASFVAVTSAVNIVAFCSANCNPGGFNGIVRTCVNIPSNICCGFPLSHISSVYVGTFPLPGGIGTWNRESGRIPACGQVMDSGGASDSVCLSTVLNGLLPSYDNGGGGMWFPVPRIDPTKTRSGSVVPKIATPVGFNNIAGFARSGFKRRSFSLVDRQMERRDSEDAMSIEELQTMIDDDPKLQCSGTRNADLFGFETGAKGVWILENPSQEQIEKLDEFPESTNQTVTNGYLAAVGATYYDDWSDHDGSLYLMNKFQGQEETVTTISNVPPAATAH